MHNFYTLLFQIGICCGISLIALRVGEKCLNSWLCLLAVAMNLFVTKQITLLGLDVTASEALAVAYLLGLSLIQEYYGKEAARKHVFTAFLCCVGFLFLTQTHLFFVPNQYDVMHGHFSAILQPIPRLILASMASFFMIQLVDIAFFSFLQYKTNGRHLTIRTGTCLIVSQILDTTIFSYLGLYGLVENLTHVMLVSFVIKTATIFLALPYVSFSKRIISFRQQKPQAVAWGLNIMHNP